MKRNVFIRADGNPTMGLGHITRCVALAYMLKSDFKIIFICKEVTESIRNEIRISGFFLVKILDELTFFNELNPSDIVVLDGYNFTLEYQQTIKEKGCRLVCIDDLYDRFFFADLIINHAPGVKKKDYHATLNTKYALGLDYALLRPSFLRRARQESGVNKIESALICFGGSDSKNLTQVALLAALTFTMLKKIIVVTGAFYHDTESLKLIIQTDSRVEHHHNINENQMFSIIKVSQLAIVPASGLLFEVLAAGCFVISGMYVDNQKVLFQNFSRLKAFTNAGRFGFEEIKVAISTVFENPGQHNKLIDGKSDERILNIFKSLN
jgi:UDP-2,4-diacetamido-2,4,6-trideoxy-beta-L-altropyranose hydrolase